MSAKLFCFIGPGASGKSSICTALSKMDLPLILSVSTTTRPPRPYEIEGREYHFIDRQTFEKRVASGLFIEHAEFAGNLYGTEFRNITQAELEKKNLILEIEIQGVRKLKQDKSLGLNSNNLVVIFICPPSRDDLVQRFRSRGSDSEARIDERMVLADIEISAALEEGFSDYVILNSDLDLSIDAARGIIIAELSKRKNLDPHIITTLLKN